MFELDFAQGSPEWLRSRIGIVSASRFKDGLTVPKANAEHEGGTPRGNDRQ